MVVCKQLYLIFYYLKIGIAGLDFMPTTTLKYKIDYSMSANSINLKLSLVFPTVFNMMKVSYFAQSKTSNYPG